MTERSVSEEPELFLWGRRINRDGSTEAWTELQKIRDRVEPAHRQQTEPDTCLYLRGWGWIFILFAELMRGNENAHVVALGREKDRIPIADCLATDCPVSTSVTSWEQIYRTLSLTSNELATLRAYLEYKSFSLRPAFNLNR